MRRRRRIVPKRNLEHFGEAILQQQSCGDKLRHLQLVKGDVSEAHLDSFEPVGLPNESGKPTAARPAADIPVRKERRLGMIRMIIGKSILAIFLGFRCVKHFTSP